MNYRATTTGLLCFVTACSAPFRAPGDHISSNTGAGGTRADVASTETPSQQYSPGNLFMKKHGEFMLAREPWRPDVMISLSGMSDAEIKNENGDFNLIHGAFDSEGRVYFDENSYLTLGATYEQHRYTFSSGATGANDDRLTQASVQIGFGYFVDDRTLVEANFEPGVYSDFSGTIHHGDWQLYANALLTYELDRSIYLKIGVEHSGLFRDLDAFPLLGVSWKIDDTFRFDLLAPKSARLTANLSKDSALNLSLDLDGGEYRIRQLQNSTQRTVNVQALELSLGGHHHVSQMLSIHARIGTTLLGDYSWGDNLGNLYDGSLEPQLFAEIGMGWDF